MTNAAEDRNGPAWVAQLFPLRALAEYDEAHGFHVAYCLETGSVTTGDDLDTVLEMMKELLEEEISNVISSKNISNLFSTPAPYDIWEKWTKLAQERPQDIRKVALDLKPQKAGKDGERTSTTIAVLAKAA